MIMTDLMICIINLIMKVIQAVKRLAPKKRLKLFTIVLIVLVSILFLVTFISLAITASNIMITEEMSTSSELDQLKDNHASYLSVQKAIIAFDVLLLIGLPFLLFSVFTFYTKGNYIITVFISVLAAIRWTMSVVILSSDSDLRSLYSRLWQHSNYGQSTQCQVQSCAELLNYVVCGKLKLWHEMMSFELAFSVIWIPFCVIAFLLAFHTNKLDLSIVQFSEQVQ